jgi:two-component system nitrogen regulation response regulator GlnG
VPPGAGLRGYPWPGNIRELQSVLKQALVRASGPVLLPAFLPETLVSGGVVSGEWSEGSAPLTTHHEPLTNLEAFIRRRLGPDAQDLYTDTHRQLNRVLLPRVLEYTGGNQDQAARLLGIARQTLRQKLRDLAVHVTHSVEADEDDR